MKRLLIFGILAVAVSCNPPKPAPTPTPPPAPELVTFDTVVCADRPINDHCFHPVVNATVIVDDKPERLQVSNGDGYNLWNIPASLVDTFITVKADGFEPFAWGTLHPVTDLVGHHNFLVLTLSTPVLPRIVAEGQHFRLADGQRFTAIGASGFTLYQRFLDGENVRPQLAQLQEIGFNVVRVFGMYWNDPANGGIGFFRPSDYPDYFDRLSAFYGLLARYGLYGEYTAFADATVALPDATAQLGHWGRLTDALRPIPNLLLDAVNEADQKVNFLAALPQLARPQGIFSSHGSNGSQVWPVQPYWDWAPFHTNGASEEQRKSSHNAMEISASLAVFTDETSRDTLPQPFDTAAACTLLNAGCTYHTTAGKYGQLLAGPALDGAHAFVNGAKSIPLDCQDGPYVHRQDLERPGILRAYQRGSDPRCVAVIHQ